MFVSVYNRTQSGSTTFNVVAEPAETIDSILKLEKSLSLTCSKLSLIRILTNCRPWSKNTSHRTSFAVSNVCRDEIPLTKRSSTIYTQAVPGPNLTRRRRYVLRLDMSIPCRGRRCVEAVKTNHNVFRTLLEDLRPLLRRLETIHINVHHAHSWSGLDVPRSDSLV